LGSLARGTNYQDAAAGNDEEQQTTTFMFDPVQINKLYTFIKRAKQTETTHKGRTKELRKKLQTSSKKCSRRQSPMLHSSGFISGV